MKALLLSVLIAVSSTVAQAASNADLCEAGKLKGATGYSQCLGKAEAKYAKSAKSQADSDMRSRSLASCEATLVKAFGALEAKYGTDCPTVGDVSAVRRYLGQCSADVTDGMKTGGVMPDYLATIASCQTDLATAQAGTATASDVARGKTFTSGAGVGVSGTAFMGTLSQTGQTTSYGEGSDGALPQGLARSFVDNGDGTITDNNTGLQWEKKSNDGSVHDLNNVYSWSQPDSSAFDGTVVTEFLAQLNAGEGFAGHKDWRLPNRFEMESLLDLENITPAVPGVFNVNCGDYSYGNPGCTVLTCSCTYDWPWYNDVKSDYWTTSTVIDYNVRAWTVQPRAALVQQKEKAGWPMHARAVRGLGAGTGSAR